MTISIEINSLFICSIGMGDRGPSQVGLTLATLGIPDTESSEAFGYELSKDALRFLQNLDLPKRESRDTRTTCHKNVSVRMAGRKILYDTEAGTGDSLRLPARTCCD